MGRGGTTYRDITESTLKYKSSSDGSDRRAVASAWQMGEVLEACKLGRMTDERAGVAWMAGRGIRGMKS